MRCLPGKGAKKDQPGEPVVPRHPPFWRHPMTTSMETLLVELAHHRAYRALRQAKQRNWFLDKLRERQLKALAAQVGGMPAGEQ